MEVVGTTYFFTIFWRVLCKSKCPVAGTDSVSDDNACAFSGSRSSDR
jgi:hypothetical protein